MCLLLYVVILQQIVVTIVCGIASKYRFLFSVIYYWVFCSVCKQTKVFFILYDTEKINYIKECIRLTAVKGKKKSTFICTELK